MVERVNPAEPVNRITISEKKMQGSVRMNIDARPYNKGAKHTRYQTDTGADDLDG